MALPSCEQLDAELSRLLLDDDDDGDRDRHAVPANGAGGGGQDVAYDARACIAQLEGRVLALERQLADALNAFQALAEQRIERAAMDAATAVSRALATAVVGDDGCTYYAMRTPTQDV